MNITIQPGGFDLTAGDPTLVGTGVVHEIGLTRAGKATHFLTETGTAYCGVTIAIRSDNDADWVTCGRCMGIARETDVPEEELDAADPAAVYVTREELPYPVMIEVPTPEAKPVRTLDDVEREIRITTDERIVATRTRDFANRDYLNSRLVVLRLERKALLTPAKPVREAKTYTRKVRATGTYVTFGKTAEMGLDATAGAWTVTCDAHSTMVAVETVALAKTSTGLDFCDGCRAAVEAS